MAKHEHKLEIFRGYLKFKSNVQKIWGVLIFLSIVTAIEVALGILKPPILMNYFLGLKLINWLFIIMTIIAISAYYTGEVDKLGRTDQYSREGWLSTGGLAIGWGILCFGLSDKIYI